MLKGLTAQYLIHSTFKVEPGMTVLVQAAAGGVGLILGQWLTARARRRSAPPAVRRRSRWPARMATRT